MAMRTKPPTSFWLISGIALLWNMMGVAAYLSQVFLTPEMMEALDEGRRAIYETTPAWATAGFATGVWMGFLGCVLLLFRKKLAIPVFILSLLGVLVQDIYFFFMSNVVEVYGPIEAIVLPALVFVAALLLIWYSKQAAGKGWIN